MTAGASCLSQCHIRSQGERDLSARIEFYPDATYAKVYRLKVEKLCEVCGESFEVESYRAADVVRCHKCRLVKRVCVHCGESFEIENGLLRSSDEIECPHCGGMNPGGKRGTITRFSKNSRKRLMEKLNKVQRDVSKVCFVTLTYPDEYYGFHDDPERWKRDLRAFELRFRRAFPYAAFVWRLEVKERLSGDHIGVNFPHYHLLVFNVSLVDLRPWVAVNWHDIAGCGSAEHYKVHRHDKAVTAVLSRRGVMSYAAKGIGEVMSSELAKELQAKGVNVGRWWGVIGEAFEWFISDLEKVELTDQQAIDLIRLFRRYLKIEGFSLPALAVFLNGWQTKQILEKMLSPPRRLRYKSTGREHIVPFWFYAHRRGLMSTDEVLALGVPFVLAGPDRVGFVPAGDVLDDLGDFRSYIDGLIESTYEVSYDGFDGS